MKEKCLLIIVALISLTVVYIEGVHAEISRIEYDVDVVDVVSNEIVVTQYVYVNVTVDGEVAVPLIASLMNVTYDLLELTVLRDGYSEVANYSVSNEDNTIYLHLKKGFNVVKLDYVVSGTIEEVAPLKYTLILNVTKPLDASLRLIIDFPMRYEVTPLFTPGNYSLTTTPSYTRFESDNDGLYIVLIEKTIVVKETSPTPPPKPVNTNRGNILLFTVMAAMFVSVGFAIFWFKYRRTMEIEATPADLLSDDTVKKIISAIGDGGEGGVKQSDLVRIVNRPKSAISRRLKRLAEEGYVSITPRGKYNIVKLTSKGYSVYRELKKKG